MSMGSTLSIMGLYNYDNTIFDLMQFPDGFTAEQKKTVIDNILVDCAEFEFLYPAPEVAKGIIGIWSSKEKPYWTRIYKASQEEYNPIENYRRTEEEDTGNSLEEKHSGTDTSRVSGSSSLSRTGSENTSGNSTVTDRESGTDTTTNKIVGYDSGTLVDHDSSSTTYGHTNTETSNAFNTITHNTTDTNSGTSQNDIVHGEKINHTGSVNRKLLAYGNIGVTTSQEMLTQEMEVAKIIQVIPIIIESFKNRFCLLVY